MSNTKISSLSSASTPLSGSEIVPINQSGTTDSVSVANLTAGRAVSMLSANIGNASSQNSVFNTVVGSASATNSGLVIVTGSTGKGWLGFNNANNASIPGQVTYNFSTNVLDFYSSGTYTFSNGNVTLSIGNLVQGTAGKGINFTANTPQSGMTSQNLNWFETGTWTPNQGSGLTVVGTFSSTGIYTRIGNLVTVQFKVSGSTSVAVGNLGIISSNLPFAVSSTVSAVGTITTLSITSSAYANSTTTNVYNSGSAISATGSIWVTVSYSI